jgi:monothiol glutaredoxin
MQLYLHSKVQLYRKLLQENDLIKNEIENNEVCLFMKGTPDAPQCGFSMATSNILKILEVNFKGINVLEDQNLREGIKVFILAFCIDWSVF